ncbi:hypothetical protein B7994_05140 [Fibrobacter sp. UWR2]|nr:hypothetical protein B7994_05140 [Fibrobacter sp. UWR2]
MRLCLLLWDVIMLEVCLDMQPILFMHHILKATPSWELLKLAVLLEKLYRLLFVRIQQQMSKVMTM